MRYKAELVKLGVLEPGELFSDKSQCYWGHAGRGEMCGEGVWIRTEVPCPPDLKHHLVYRITVVP